MAIKIELYVGEFLNMFDQYGRTDQFSVCAKEALYEHLEELSDDLGDDVTIDIVGLCCDWTEYSAGDLLRDYGKQYLPDDRESYDSDEAATEALFTALQEETTILKLRNGAYLVQVF